MSDLLTHPLFTADTLGSPLPPDDFGVSVSLPLWSHVIGYEEGDLAVTSKFRSGYPRFFLPPPIAELFAATEGDVCAQGERCIVFPRYVHAQRCVEWLAKHGHSGRAIRHGELSLGVCLFPMAAYDVARKFWRFAGEVVSSRQALQALGRGDGTMAADGETASAMLRERLARLSGQRAEDVFLFPSGMAATFAVHRMLCALTPGRRSVQLGFPYVDVLKVQQYFGTGVEFLPTLDESSYERLATLLASEPISAVFSEAPTNPLLQCCDYARLRAMHGEVPFVIDDTVGSVVNLDAFRVADVVTTSLTKGFSGKGDVLAGSVIVNRASPHHTAYATWLREHHDHGLFCADAVVLERNSRDVEARAAVMSRNSLGLYKHLSQHPKIARVWHSANEGGPGFAQLQRAGGGHGCLFSILLKDVSRTPAFYDALEVCKGPSLGTDFTLVCPYTLLAHYDELPWAAECGVPRDLIRISAGLEPLDDLIARFDRALEA